MVCKSWVDMLRYRLYIFVKNKVSCYLNHIIHLINCETRRSQVTSVCRFVNFTHLHVYKANTQKIT